MFYLWRNSWRLWFFVSLVVVLNVWLPAISNKLLLLSFCSHSIQSRTRWGYNATDKIIYSGICSALCLHMAGSTSLHFITALSQKHPVYQNSVSIAVQSIILKLNVTVTQIWKNCYWHVLRLNINQHSLPVCPFYCCNHVHLCCSGSGQTPQSWRLLQMTRVRRLRKPSLFQCRRYQTFSLQSLTGRCWQIQRTWKTGMCRWELASLGEKEVQMIMLEG